jgi:PAS domain S-box-containing protein
MPLSSVSDLSMPVNLVNVCGTELLAGDTRERYRQKLARITLDSMVQFVGLLDANGTVLEINRVALDAVGIKLSDVEGKPFWTTFWWQVSDEINATLRDAIRRASQGEFVRWDAEIYGRAGGKETIIIDASLMPVKDEQGNVVFITAEGRDITEKKAHEREIARQREELAKLDELKTQFFANISHEFRTPLTLMMGPLEDALTESAKLSSPNRGQLELAYRNSLRLLKLVNTLLDFSRIEAGRIQATYEPTDLALLTAELASVFRSAIERAGMKLVVECAPLSESVYVDRDMWEKIVLNLVSNAFKFTFEGEIEVTLGEVGDAVELTVRDTGTGIPVEEIPRLFDRFHRAKGARGRSYEGSGIGLALVQELVKLHGGNVRVQSEVGHGSSFIVSIPRGKSHLPVGRIDAERPVASTGQRNEAYVEEVLRWLPDSPRTEQIANDRALEGVYREDLHSGGAKVQRILLADDNADMRDYVRRLLTQSGYEVEAVADGLAALSAARARKPDLVLTDVMMPGMDGFALLRELRADSMLGSVPIIMLSARAGEEARIEGMQAGADDYLIKPFSARELLARAESHLRMARFRHEAAEAVRLRTAQFETLLNQAPLGVYLVDADFRIREVNPVALPTFGDIPGGVIGRDFDEIIHILWEKTYADEVVGIFRHTLETGESYIAPERAEHRADRGVLEHYEWRLDRIPLPDGHFGVVCYFWDVSAQVRAREEIARSEERFRAFVTASSDAVYRMSADWSEMRYLRGADFIPDIEDASRGWIENYIPVDDRPRVLAAIQQAIRTKIVFELEHRVIRLDGTLGWTFSRAIPLLDAKGNIVEWFGTAADVTERKRAEEAFARLTVHSEQQRRLYQTILSSTPDLIYVFDLNHRFTYANEALLRMWGKTAEEAIGKNCLELGYEPWHAAMHDREIEQVIASKRPVRGDVPFSGTQGRRIYDYIFVPVFDVNGEVEAIAGTTRDVTDRTLAEERIRDSEERLRFMAESMPQKIFTAKPNGEMDYFNRQWMEFTGLTFEDLRGWNWTHVVHPDDAAENLRVWRYSVDSGEPFQMIHRFRRADGSYRWHLSRAHAMRDNDANVTMWIGSSTEIHEQKDTEENLRRANQDLEQFAYAATHDLQEPLRGITIYSDLLAKRYGARLDGQALEFLNYIRGGATRMEMLVRDLLSYTQIDKLEDPVKLRDAGECLQIALANLAGAIEESGAQVSSESLPSVKIHATHLQQIFQNLIGNAIKYRRPGTAPIVHVSAQCENGQCRFTVADNGIGIEPKYKELIFGLFKRLHTNDQYAGTGVGLALCKRIVERNHGSIWVESEPEKGSQFHFTLPV